MKTFEQFLSDAARHGGINVVFESAMYSLVNDLEKIVRLFREAGVRFEVIGGVAVNAHILSLHRSRSFVTRDIDVLVHRSDLEILSKVGEAAGYKAKKMMGGYALIRPEQDLAEAVHLLFAGERSKSTQPYPHPEIQPEEKDLFGVTVPIAPLKDLVHMKLNSMRPKDLIHLETLDDLSLITPAIEQSLPEVLWERLGQARAQIAAGKPDIEE